VFLPGEDPYRLSQFAGDSKEEPGVPIIQMPDAEARLEARPPSTTNGRRRRRRSRGTQRPDGPPQDGTMQLDESGELEGDDVEYSVPDELSLPELFDPLHPEAEPTSQEQYDARSEDVFEELLDIVENEAAETETIAELAPPEFLAELTGPEASDVTGEATPEPAPAVIVAPFTDVEWQLLGDVVGRLERPASFQQIHDLLRDARNNAGITRTNEELRSLIKQGINSGMLERIGKGNRASYRLAPPAEEGAPDQAEQIAQAQSEQLPEAQPEFYTPEAAAQAAQFGMETPEVIAESEATPEPAKPAEKPKRPRRKPAGEAAPAPTAEAAPAKPARGSRKKAAAAPPAAAETIEAPTEEPAKPKRSRRKKSAE
ncbi:MAG TPA: hypothetical protein VFU22_13705, partial [Roseiflexaceae bacterium]|nr:hypothetical protein [Roseiflexaceae bacterium]